MTKSVSRQRKMRMILILAALLCVSMAYACDFWAILSSTSIPDAYLDSDDGDFYSSGAGWLCETARINNDDDGWGVIYYDGSLPLSVQRSVGASAIYDGVDDCDDDFIDFLDLAIDDDAALLLAHARLSYYNGGVPGPHPFVYERGEHFFTLMHNGTIYFPCTIGNEIGAQYAALDIFVDREYTAWYDVDDYDEGNYIVDTEYYAALMMKQLLIAENYYTDVWDTESEMWYAIQSTKAKIAALGPPFYSSINVAIAEDGDLWIVKSENDDDYNVSYWNPDPPDNSLKMVSTQNRSAENNWSELTTNHRFMEFVAGDANPAPEVFTAVEQEPEELRINRGNTNGDQVSPAVAVDPVNSTFAVVWKDNEEEQLMLSWRNQMGLAEGDPFTIAISGDGCRMPAIDYLNDGNEVLVVWSEMPSGGAYFSQIKGQRFEWDYATLTWSAVGGQTTYSYTTNEDLSHPAVATRASNDWTVVWQRWNSTNSNYEIRYKALSGGMGIINDQPVATVSDNLEPDIAELENDTHGNYIITWAREYSKYSQIMSRCIAASGVSLGTEKRLAYSDLNEPGLNINTAVASSAVLSDGVFWVGYYSGSSIMGIQAGVSTTNTISVLLTQTGVTITDNVPEIDATIRKGQTCDVCFSDDEDIYVQNFSDRMGVPGAAFMINEASADERAYPAIAVSHDYKCISASGDARGADYYETISVDSPFDERRLVVWQADDQDGDGWGITGNIEGALAQYCWYEDDDIDDDVADQGVGKCSSSGNLVKPIDPPMRDRHTLDEATEVLPTEFALHAAYPNPFNPSTTFSFDIAEAGEVRINVFDLRGRLVSELVRGHYTEGTYNATFNGTVLPTGTYFVRMEAGNYHGTQKILLIK